MKLPVNYNKLTSRSRKAIREQYVQLQEGICCHCGCSLSGEASKKVMGLKVNKGLFPRGFFNWPIHLHHDHTTGMTIGAIHCYCNAVLWQYHGE